MIGRPRSSSRPGRMRIARGMVAEFRSTAPARLSDRLARPQRPTAQCQHRLGDDQAPRRSMRSASSRTSPNARRPGADQLSRPSRRTDRAAEPGSVPRPFHAGHRQGPNIAGNRWRYCFRPRPFRDDQRLARSSGRRHAAQAGGREAAPMRSRHQTPSAASARRVLIDRHRLSHARSVTQVANKILETGRPFGSKGAGEQPAVDGRRRLGPPAAARCSLLKKAGGALSGQGRQRNTARFYRADERRRARTHYRLRRRCTARSTRTEFELHLPAADRLATRQVVSVEALLRWNRGGTELVATRSSSAEESGLIVPSATAVLGRSLRSWPRCAGRGFPGNDQRPVGNSRTVTVPP